MSTFAATTLNHLRAVAALVRGRRVRATIDPITFGLDLRAGGRGVRFVPQFVFRDGQQLRYTPNFEDRVTGFIGWRPYFNKRWPIALDKVEFKRFCLSNGVPTPSFWIGEPPDGRAPIIIKRRGGSFGEGIRGPFPAGNAVPREVVCAADEYAEEFVRGRAGKAWYWDGQFCAVEYCDPATVTGDGRATIAELLQTAAVGQTREPDRSVVESCLRLQGLVAETRPSHGERVTVDFRYGAPLATIAVRDDGGSNFLREIDGAPVAARLMEAGEACWQGIPEAIRAGTLFTLDFVEDADQSLYFLEMNCNPMVHPDVYPAMFRGLFGSVFDIDTASTGAPRGNSAFASILEHLKALRSQLLVLKAQASIDAADLVLRIIANGRTVHLQPRFLHRLDGDTRVTHTMPSTISGFAGWLPYLARRWPFAENRPQLDAFVRSCGVAPANDGDEIALRAWFWNGRLTGSGVGNGATSPHGAAELPELAALGQRLWHGLSAQYRIDTLFAVDLIRGADGNLQVDSLDPDSPVPPTAYARLLGFLFPEPAAAASPDQLTGICLT